jgi:NAD(P)-dependent dehydrogenase (short-subunit alcohol dehydrogenase family)
MSGLDLNTAVILGARNLGAAIARDLLASDVRVASVARTQTDLEALEQEGAVPIRGDAADPEQLMGALARAGAAIGPPDLIVNAVSASLPPNDGTGFGGGALASASPAGFEGWTSAVARQAFAFLTAGTRSLEGREGTLVQIVGAPARRTNAERGLFAAGCAAVRALAHAAALEVREAGIHVALLIVDGIIASPKTAQMSRGMAASALVHHDDVTRAVRFLATQSPHGMTHELVLTPAGGRWVP